MKWRSESPDWWQQGLEILGTAGLYVVLARLGQLFAIDPGNVTPVWLPSGVMLALVALRGNYLLAGVFLGAFTGNAWAYLEFSSAEAALRGLTAGTMNGIGDVLCVMLGLAALGRAGGIAGVFRRAEEIRNFLVLAVGAGPAVSALLGIGGLALMGFMDWSDAPYGFYTWLVGDAVGVLLLTPLILSYSEQSGRLPKGNAPRWERALFLAIPILPVVDGLLGRVGIPLESAFLAAPLLLWVLIRGGVRTALWTVVGFVLVSLLITIGGPETGLEEGSIGVDSLQLLIGVTMASLLFFATIVWQQERYLEVVTHAATRDALTDAWNRRTLLDRLEVELRAMERQGTELSLVMFDLDNFKEINDRLGHASGDEVLRGFTRLAQEELRTSDVFARWGGDEFLLVLPGCGSTAAGALAERIRVATTRAHLVPDASVTVSAGVVEAGRGITPDRLVSAADDVLYEAKFSGRDRVCVEQGRIAVSGGLRSPRR